jgi:UDP-glucose 4-epimerase
MQKIVITGGAGYIGSHVCLALHAAGYEPVILDALTDTRRSVLERLQRLKGQPMVVEHCSLEDGGLVRQVLERHQPVAVIHLAAPPGLRLPALKENQRARSKALDAHVWYGLNLIQAMEAAGCRTLLAAGSDDVYAQPALAPLAESAMKASHVQPGDANHALEGLYEAVHTTSRAWRIGVLRLFEVVGAHPSHGLGPAMAREHPDWLMEMAHVAAGLLPEACVRGHGLPTPDGTAVMDYVHVQDVAQAFIKALDTLETYGESFVVNIGSGRPTSMLDALTCFEATCGKKLPVRRLPREGESPIQSVADIALARELLGWQPKHSLQSICEDTWRWHAHYLQHKLSA